MLDLISTNVSFWHLHFFNYMHEAKNTVPFCVLIVLYFERHASNSNMTAGASRKTVIYLNVLKLKLAVNVYTHCGKFCFMNDRLLNM